MIRELWIRYRQFFLYSLIGAFSAGTDFAVYAILQRDIHYLFANSISVLVGITLSFLLNAGLNFKVTNQLRRRFIIFFAVGMIGLLVSTLLLALFIDRVHLHAIFAKTLTLGIVLILQYSLNKRFSFRSL